VFVVDTIPGLPTGFVTVGWEGLQRTHLTVRYRA
jgi:hypothetical protein